MAIKLSLNRTLYSYDNQLEAHATDTTVIKVQIYTDYDLSDSVLVYKQGDVQDSVAIVDNAAEIPGLNIRSGQLSVAVLYANTLSNFVQIYVTKVAALSQTLVDDDPYFTVDRNKRLISVPSTQDMLAVNFDENSEIITFKFPRYADGVDLSTKAIYVNYERSDKTRNKALCTLTDISDSYVIFTWVVSAYATQAEGILNFNIEFHSAGYRWQTQPTSLLVYRSLLYTGETVPDQPELLDQYLAMFSELNSHPPIPGDDGYWQIWSLDTHSYETSEFLLPTVDSTLTKAGQAADAKATGDAIRSLSEEIADLSTLTLGVHTDGLVYIFLNGAPVGTGVKIDGSIVVDGDTVELSDGITLTTLMFSDDFDGDHLSDVWKPSYGYDNAALNSWWTADEKNLGVANSCVRFTMLRDNPTADFAISAAKIETMQHGTANNYGFDTGYCEVRFKLDKVGAGIWPAIWCVGQTQTDEYTNITATSVTRTLHGRTWPWAGEIDQLDGIGSAFTPGLSYQTDPYVSSVLTMKGSQKVTLEADTWHTIGVYKTKDVIKIYWDRELIDTFDISGIDCFSGMGERLILNLATGKNLGGALPDDITEVNMFVDYVKVYSLSNTFTTLAEQNTATLLPDYAGGFACVSGRNFLLHPQFAENTQNTALYWGSSNAAVAKVENGYVTTVANGECTISATDADGNQIISFPMTVKENAGVLATKLKILSKTTNLGIGESVEIDAHIYPTSCDNLTPTLSIVTGSEYCTIDGLTITNTNQSGANQNAVIRVSTNNPEVYEDITIQMIGYIADTIDTNGIVAKYTRKGWSADAWTSDLETNPAVAATNNDATGWKYTAGLGYKKGYNSGSVATIGTDLFNIDGPFTLVSRMHYEPGANIGSGGNAFEVINSDDSGAGNIEPNVGQNRIYTKDATATNRQIGSFFGDTSRDTTDGATYNVVLVKDESRNLTVYINGVQTAQSTYYSTVDPMGLTGMVFRFPKGSVYSAYYQAMLAYNRAMTAEEIVALHEALEEMYA